MSRLYNGTAEYHEHLAAILTATPLSMACYFYGTSDAAANNVLFQLVNSSGVRNFHTIAAIGGGGASNVVQAASRSGAAAAAGADSTTNWSTDQWHHAVGVFASDSDRRAYLDGGGKGTDTTTKSPSGLDRSIVAAAQGALGKTAHFPGAIAHLGIWDVALTDNEALLLARGILPIFIRPTNLNLYLPLGLADTEPDLSGNGFAFSINNSPSVEDNPPTGLWFGWDAAPTYTAPAVTNPPGVRAYHDVATTIATGTWTAVAMNSELGDTDSMHDVVTNNDRITIQTDGFYNFDFHAAWELTATTGLRGIRVKLNGSVVVTDYTRSEYGTVHWTHSMSYSGHFSAGDTLDVEVAQNTGGDLDLRSVAWNTPHHAGAQVSADTVVSDLSLSETDAVTVGDTASLDPVSPTTTAQVDAVGLGEAIQMELQSFLSESEAVSVGEQVVLELLSFLGEVDAVTVGEDVTVDPISPTQIAQVDEITVGEAVQMFLRSFISQSEAITVSESVELELLSFIDQLDAVAVGESVKMELLSFVTASEDVTVGESVTVGITEQDLISINVSDGVTVGENVISGPVSDPMLTALDMLTVGDIVELTGLEPDAGDWGPDTRKKVREKFQPRPIEKVPAREVRMAQEMQRRRQERLERQKQLEEKARKKQEYQEKVKMELERMKREFEEGEDRRRKRAIALINLRKAQKAREEKNK